MSQFSFLPGVPPIRNAPLVRYLPPIPEGVISAWLTQRLPPGAWVIDPYGAQPRLAVEAAHAGYRVLVAANNPIERFLLELIATPPKESELRAALADLAATQKAGERIEPHIRALYHTECAQCGQTVMAEAFTWERDATAPATRLYHCPNCNDSGERPATPGDAERVAQFGSGGIHRVRALERVAPLDDPDRVYAEEALSAYLPRAVYILFTLINKLDGLPPARRRLIAALLLAVLDQANTMWPQPATRARPRQITVPPRFREKNIWLALEDAVELWGINARQPAIPMTTWPTLPPKTGGISLFAGPLRDLAEEIGRTPPESFSIQAVIGAIPRPNQAYWTLSALWAGWIWGYEGTAHFKSVLRRRRYDWAWHAAALQAANHNLAQIIPPGIPFLGLIGESEPGYLAAALVAAEMSGFSLDGLALRDENGQAQIAWQNTAHTLAVVEKHLLQQQTEQAAQSYLRQRNEPASFAQLHAAALSQVVQTHSLLTIQDASPAEVLSQVQESLHQVFANRATFIRLHGSERSPESGQWWLREDIFANTSSEATAWKTNLSMMDRVEMEVVRFLQKNPGCTLAQIDQAICDAFPVLQASTILPDLELITECLKSFGQEMKTGTKTSPVEGSAPNSIWQLRPQDEPHARRSDLETMHRLLKQIGISLGYTIAEQDFPTRAGLPVRTALLWQKPSGHTVYAWYVLASAMIGNFIFTPLETAATRNILVVPGSRASLLAYKLAHDGRLQSAAQTNWRLIKFRHVRRLAEDASLSPENLEERLDMDPLANSDPQMPLL